MKITIIGTGYVGLVSGTCLAETGVTVTCLDIDVEKIEKLNKGIIPIYEPGLSPMVLRNVQSGRLKFTTDPCEAISESQVVFIAVGTPPDEDGSADLKYVLEAASVIGREMNDYLVVITKSTVPIGTAEKVRATIKTELERRRSNIEFDVASNPEFLKEGDAVNDCMKPDRIVVGTDSERAFKILEKLYKPFILNGHPVIYMDIPSAELTKYAANAMLATKISFINDIANLCELVGADINMVRRGIGSDSRIGNKFIYAGIGYGGSCFPKDVKAIIKTAEGFGYELKVMKAVEEVNNLQKEYLYHKTLQYFSNDLKDKKIGLWGLSFKPNTDDMREAPALALIEKLISAGAHIAAFDPVAMDEAKRRLGDKIRYASDAYDALVDADAMLLATEWSEFRNPNWTVIGRLMNTRVVFDGRNIYERDAIEQAGFEYFGIGR
ncbi:MAG TPA: UDP-glucose/GDP-mannose dehydrogenase family protein [Bacteroidales bacterium]|nr:UDP-glucose/GDP-mannose dehydrogenase family protein [Bacteroidales bacterium]